MTKARLVTAVVGGAALAALLGAAQFLRGTTAVSPPDIQTALVQLQDGRTLNVQTREVTVAQWQACHAAGQCTLDLVAQLKNTDFPATGLSFPDAMEYLRWINSFGAAAWRLPSAAEWYEIAAEVMPETPDPIFTDPSLSWASGYLTEARKTGRALRPSGAFATTSAGIQDLDGNVWEWTGDCYAGSSGQGQILDIERCPAFVMGGEHKAVVPYLVRDPAQGGCAVGAPPAHLGMRIVADS